MKLTIGGSPCTHWSIAKKQGRETEPEGQGWELFQNYKIALVKFRPDYFLYENNNSISAAIKERITLELGVEPIRINSELVSAQSRERIYWTNIPGVQQPEDCGIMLRDVLESGVCWREKSYTLRASAGPHQGMSNITALLHDVCKVDFYEKEGEFGYRVNNLFPIGHGEKSVILIVQHMKLTNEEIMAIRWHMGAFEDRASGRDLIQTWEKCPLALHLHLADMEATWFDEKREPQK